MSDIDQRDRAKTAGRLSLMNDLYVDLLGSLVPGLMTVILGGTALYLGLVTLNIALFHAPMLTGGLTTGVKDLLTGLHWEFATVIMVSAFVIGSVFFRQDPKRPDAISALHVWVSSKEKEKAGLAVQCVGQRPPETMRDDPDATLPLAMRLDAFLRPNHYIRRLGLDTQFPYLHLRCYLAARSLEHLVPLVPWCPKVKAQCGHRTKMFINLIKIRVFAVQPELARDLIRNEAHVRLATSVWYACGLLGHIAAAVLMLLGGIFPYADSLEARKSLFMSGAFVLLLLIFCVTMRYHLRKCIHYMRVREVIYVLETAHIIERANAPGLLSEISFRGGGNSCKDCERPRSASAGSHLGEPG